MAGFFVDVLLGRTTRVKVGKSVTLGVMVTPFTVGVGVSVAVANGLSVCPVAVANTNGLLSLVNVKTRKTARHTITTYINATAIAKLFVFGVYSC